MLRLLVLILSMEVRRLIIVQKEIVAKSCSEIIINFKDYKCLEKENSYLEEGTFIIQKEDTKYLLSSQKDREKAEILESIKQIEEIQEDLPKKISSKKVGEETYQIYTYPENGNILEYIKNLKTQNEKLRLFVKILTLVSQIHAKNIIINNITPQNIFINNRKNPIFLDFSKSVENEKKAIPSGSIEFTSPEMLQHYKTLEQKYTPKQDIWSLGILFYLILYNKLPFKAKTNNEFISELFYSKGIFIEKNTSLNIVTILNSMLKLEPSNRGSLYEIEAECIEGVVNMNKRITDNDSYLDLRIGGIYRLGYLDMFSEMIFVLFVVFFIIPVSVYLVSKNVDKEEDADLSRETVF